MLRPKKSLKRYIQISSKIPGPKEVAMAEVQDLLRIINRESTNLRKRENINLGSNKTINQKNKKDISLKNQEMTMRETMIKS